MKTGHYSISDIFSFQGLDQLVVPEIQRDYIWEADDVLDLLTSLIEGLRESEDVPYLGFIYAYSHKDSPYKFILIDGQQRMTTIFLLLLVCYRKLGKKLPRYLGKGDKIKLDYKVRQATHDFLRDLVESDIDYNENNKIEDQLWFHVEYKNDVTVQNIVKNYGTIRQWVDALSTEDLNRLLKMTEDEVGLSYFNVEDGRQGEELYIYMNSRGRQLEPNETLKAKFLSGIKKNEDKLVWGRKWEKWQDFFWKHRESFPDADHGFNEFLRRIQIINMCSLNKSSDEIVGFATGRNNIKLEIGLLPKTLDEIDEYFEAYKFLVESDSVKKFFLANNESVNYLITTPMTERRQVYYLRTLPTLALLARTKLRDDMSIKRFLRFFYNVARKMNVGKDISNQFPISIKLILEYTKKERSNYDVTDFENYQKGRTVLIDDEEIVKFYIYRTPPENILRSDVEKHFWAAEDHEIFRGEIEFLLSGSIEELSNEFSFDLFKKHLSSFNELFPINKSHKKEIIRTLLFYGSTWTLHTPYYYDNYKCDNWSDVIRGDSSRHLLRLIADMHGHSIAYLEEIFKKKIAEYFTENGITTVNTLKDQKGLFNQIKTLSAIDFYSDKKLWNGVYHIAEDDRYTFGDISFFVEDRLIYNIAKYVNDGLQGRVFPLMKNVLQDEVRLTQVLNTIIESK